MSNRQTGHRDASALTAALAADVDAAFEDLVRATQDDLFSGALRLTGSRADAEELTQETFVRAYDALRGYSTARIRDLKVRAWLWTIAANLCRNRARSRSRRPEVPLPEAPQATDPRPGPERQTMASDERSRLVAHLSALPWPMRLAVVLRHIVGLPYAEIADALERPVGTVKADVHRGLARLRDTMEEAQWMTD